MEVSCQLYPSAALPPGKNSGTNRIEGSVCPKILSHRNTQINKFDKNPFQWEPSFPTRTDKREDGRTERQAHITKWTVAFFNFAKAPKNCSRFSCSSTTYNYAVTFLSHRLYRLVDNKETSLPAQQKQSLHYFLLKQNVDVCSCPDIPFFF